MIVIIDVHVDPREVNFSESEELLLYSAKYVDCRLSSRNKQGAKYYTLYNGAFIL